MEPVLDRSLWSRSKLLVAALLIVSRLACASELVPVVEIQEEVYTYTDAHNGSGPLWDHGSTNLVRVGETVFVSGVDTLPNLPPLNNTQCRLWRRDASGWRSNGLPESGQTREPCPLVVFPGRQEVLLSANPTLNPGGTSGQGPAKPTILRFAINESGMSTEISHPRWRRGVSASFTEHSYRSFAADGERAELVLFQNVGYDRAEWTFRDSSGAWAAQGQLNWPSDGRYESALSIRLCYPNVLLQERAIHFVGVSDIVEPNEAWRRFKRELTGVEWDYVFRRLFYTWTPDVANEYFADWVEIASREQTAGRIALGDIWYGPDGLVHIVWEETALDMRLRGKFFPKEKQRWELNHAVLRAGRIVAQHTLASIDEDHPGPIAHLPRFHVTPDGRLFVFFYLNGTSESGQVVSENRLLEINRHGPIGASVLVPLDVPLSMYMTASGRAGSKPSSYLDLLGIAPEKPNVVRYVRVRVE